MTLAVIFDSVGVGEWFVLLAVVLVVVGPKRLPSTARKFGQYYSKFRRAAESFKRQLLDMDTEFTNTIRETTHEVRDAFADVSQPVEPPQSAADVPFAEPPPVAEPPVAEPAVAETDNGYSNQQS